MLNSHAKSVECRGDYVLSVEFVTGERGLLDMKPYLDFGVFTALREPRMFQTAHIVAGALTWDCGADLDPEFTYAKCGLGKSEAQKPLQVEVHWDDEAEVWCASSDDIHGLAIEGATESALVERLKDIIPELWELNHAGQKLAPVELVFGGKRRIELPAGV